VDTVAQAAYDGAIAFEQVLELTERLIAQSSNEASPILEPNRYALSLREDSSDRRAVLYVPFAPGRVREFEFELAGPVLPVIEQRLPKETIGKRKLAITYGMKEDGMEYCICILHYNTLPTRATAEALDAGPVQVGSFVRFGRDPVWKPITLSYLQENGEAHWRQEYGEAVPQDSPSLEPERVAFIASTVESLVR
jgi:hypothetical protein